MPAARINASMLRPLLMLSILAIVTGCTTSTTTGSATSAAQGQAIAGGNLINCSGANSGWVFCYRSAAEVCGVAGYTVLSRSDQAPAAAGSDTRTMIVKCN